MLKKIKSTYFIKNLFLYVLEKKKLKLVKYNKSLQKNIDKVLLILNFSQENILYINQVELEKNILFIIMIF